MAKEWKEELHHKLIDKYGQEQGLVIARSYEEGFPHSYQEDYTPEAALLDIESLRNISEQNPLVIRLYFDSDQEPRTLHLRLFQCQKPLPLSDVLPILENLDLRIEREVTQKVKRDANELLWISDFAVIHHQSPHFNIEKVKDLFQDTFLQVYQGTAENDGFNKLVLNAFLSCREIMILRTFAKYLRQAMFRFSQAYVEKALLSHATITRDLVDLFLHLHNPSIAANKEEVDQIEQKIIDGLEKVTSLDEDRIIRRILTLIKSTLRTNFFQKDANNKAKNYLAIKLNSRQIPELPLPIPLYEIFIYSPRFEGIHLRNTKVARGGIRWSDRPEDFRTEILGLMKAQTVKNAVIVPSGAKGGFVLKALSPQATSAQIKEEVVVCYRLFINGLLDLSDNINLIDKKTIPPVDVVCHDDPDPYLVVAADKGTATFSDVANSIALERNFWLQDAFASGGSAGYDHKKMGITAKGAWESVKRHFRELNINVEKEPITVVGVGDMSGDVFGNGMIYSPYLKLVAAFDHRHIFLDPNPQSEIAYEERLRLFNLPTSSWEDYNANLISEGGGVYKRSAKSITLSSQMQKILGTEEVTFTPNELIRVILKAPVDLLFNGGIGTYVKGSTQSHADVGDRTNDYCRVDGCELRCKAVGEGGNLGFTQRGRVEFAFNGGLINTDFIDNSAGVDCSDHEVNLKILLSPEIQKGNLAIEDRNKLLASLTKEIAELVLQDNYYQALVMSFSTFHAQSNIGLHTNYIKELESQGFLNRQIEFLPDDKTLLERKTSGLGLMRPEIAVLLAYTKIHIQQGILKSDIPEDPYLSQVIVTAFPPSIRKKYAEIMYEHRLKRDIIATQLSNQVVNTMGITFVYRLQMETGATVDEIIRAHAVSLQIFDVTQVQKLIESLDYKISKAEQYGMLFNVRNLIGIACRWFLNSKYLQGDLKQLVEHFSPRIKSLEKLIPKLISGVTKNYLKTLTEQFLKAGIYQEVAERIAIYRVSYASLNIIEVATKYNFDLVKTAQVYFLCGAQFNLVWFRDQIWHDAREGHWNTLARLTLRDKLDESQRAFTVAIMKSANEDEPKELVDRWINKNKRKVEQWEKTLKLLHSSTNVDYTMFFVSIRELNKLIRLSR